MTTNNSGVFHRNAPALFAISSDLPQKMKGRGATSMGAAHYSYGIVRDKFCALLDSRNISWVPLRNPEAFKEGNIKYTKLKDPSARPIHISFKPPAHLRPVHGLKNIAHIAWEFNKLRDPLSVHPWSPVNDDARILSNFDQVWVGSDFTRGVLEKEGIRNVHVVPAPTRASPLHLRDKSIDILGRLQRNDSFSVMCTPISSRNHRFRFAQTPSPAPVSAFHLLSNVRRSPAGKAFLAVVNPHDWRKNTAKIIRSFTALHQERRDSVLILKASYDAKSDPNLFEKIMRESHIFDAEGVYITTDFIPDIYLYDFMSCFNFYVCASHAEGQNLPLLEAMAAGVVPVSVANTAMADYINESTAFSIPSHAQMIAPPDNPDETLWGMEWYETKETEILDALHRAMTASATEIDLKRQKAMSRIDERYSFEAVTAMMNLALDGL